jgi:hypothetical protein
MTRPTDNPRTTRDVLSPARGVTSVEAVDELNASDLDREIAFAEMSVADDDPATQDWLDALRERQAREASR